MKSLHGYHKKKVMKFENSCRRREDWDTNDLRKDGDTKCVWQLASNEGKMIHNFFVSQEQKWGYGMISLSRIYGSDVSYIKYVFYEGIYYCTNVFH